MYLEYYGLKEPPFSITPDPRFVFLSERHRDALAHLVFGIGQGGGGGFVQLTGEVGTGKTTLSRLLLERLPDNTRVALVLNPRLSPAELLETICEELHLDLEDKRGSLKALVDLLNHYLLDAYAKGLRVVLIIDEAQNLSVEALEQVRLLTNLETSTQKLLQIILIGQPELRTMLAREDLRQLAQRITARFHLTPLNAAETEAYLRHRFAVAGGARFPFSANAIKRIHAHARGVPRLINVIAERALLAGFAHDLSVVDERWVERAAKEALAPNKSRVPHLRHAIAAVIVVLVLVGVASWWRPRADAVAQPVAAPIVAPVAALVPKPAITTPHIDSDELSRRVREATASQDAAWQQLLTLWQVPAAADARTAATCSPSLAPGMYCLRGSAGLDRLASQGQPALLRLRAQGHEAWGVLLGADAVKVRLWLDGNMFDVDRLALDRAWSGEYVVLWRAPSTLTEPLLADARGPAVEWVRSRLGPRYLAADGEALLDTAMRDAVRRFQADRGLRSDGVVGPETLLALADDHDGPRLQRVLE
jgi:general secretion pathway protein A